jgi:hypothetical protein
VLAAPQLGEATMLDFITTGREAQQYDRGEPSRDSIARLCDCLEQGGQRSYPAPAQDINTFALHQAARPYFREIKSRTHKVMARLILKHLDPYEFTVWYVLAERTFGWSKLAERVTEAHFSHGVPTGEVPATEPDRDGLPFFSGCRVGTTKLYSVKRRLLRSGFISVKHAKMWGVDAKIYCPIPLWLVGTEIAGALILRAQALSMDEDALRIARCYGDATHGWECDASTETPFDRLVTRERSEALSAALSKVGINTE